MTDRAQAAMVMASGDEDGKRAATLTERRPQASDSELQAILRFSEMTRLLVPIRTMNEFPSASPRYPLETR